MIDLLKPQFYYQDGNGVSPGSLPFPHTDRPDYPSVFCFALPKSGSVLLNAVAVDLFAAVGVPAYDFPGAMFSLGIEMGCMLGNIEELFPARGYFFHNFRVKPRWMLGSSAVLDRRKLMLVRDPRDMLVSLYYSLKLSHAGIEQRGTAGFSAQAQKLKADTEKTLDDYCIEYAAQMSFMLGSYNDILGLENTLLLRYEDIVYDKLTMARQVCRFCDLEVGEERIREIVAPHDIIPSADDPMSHIRQVHPGDHRRKLAPRTIEVLDIVLKGFLDRFDYAR